MLVDKSGSSQGGCLVGVATHMAKWYPLMRVRREKSGSTVRVCLGVSRQHFGSPCLYRAFHLLYPSVRVRRENSGNSQGAVGVATHVAKWVLSVLGRMGI